MQLVRKKNCARILFDAQFGMWFVGERPILMASTKYNEAYINDFPLHVYRELIKSFPETAVFISKEGGGEAEKMPPLVQRFDVSVAARSLWAKHGADFLDNILMGIGISHDGTVVYQPSLPTNETIMKGVRR